MKLLEPYREQLLKLALENGVTRLRVFGSVARGEERPDSDVDFLVDFGEKISSWGGVGFQMGAETLLQKKVHVVSSNGIYPPLRKVILRDARDL
jgi:uncharacterized protein